MIERLLAADAALERGEIDHAEQVFAQVAGADARNAIALVGLARVAARRGATAEAMSLAHRALEIDPQEAAARRLLDELETALRRPVATPQASSPDRSGWRAWLARLLRRG